MNILGIDPGLTGALAYIGDDNMATVMDMPLTAGFHGKQMVDVTTIVDVVENMWKSPEYIIIETPTFRHGNAAVSTTTTWFNYGRLTAAFTDWGEVMPATWKKQLKLSHDKRESLEMARGLFPHLASLLSRQKDHGRAEALLIAEWFRRSQGSDILI